MFINLLFNDFIKMLALYRNVNSKEMNKDFRWHEKGIIFAVIVGKLNNVVQVIKLVNKQIESNISV